jgi:hypothetical protein
VDPGSGSIPAHTTPVLIGARRQLGAPIAFLNGQIDELRVWRTARSAAEIQDNQNGRLIGTNAFLAAYYPANELAGLTVPDASGRGLAGILTGGALWNQAEDATQPVAHAQSASAVTSGTAVLTARLSGADSVTTNRFLFGLGSTALRFDGVNDKVAVPHAVTLNSFPLSLTAWVRGGGSSTGWMPTRLSSSRYSPRRPRRPRRACWRRVRRD